MTVVVVIVAVAVVHVADAMLNASDMTTTTTDMESTKTIIQNQKTNIVASIVATRKTSAKQSFPLVTNAFVILLKIQDEDQH